MIISCMYSLLNCKKVNSDVDNTLYVFLRDKVSFLDVYRDKNTGWSPEGLYGIFDHVSTGII